MSAQTRYGYSTQRGIPGGLFDLTCYTIDTRANEEENGKLMYGMGVVCGSVPGSNIKLPAEGATVETFEGITVNGMTQQFDLDGKLFIRKGQHVGVIRNGRIYGRLAKDVTVAYGEKACLVISGDDAGKFTNVADGALAVGKFVSVDNTDGIAVIEL